MTVSSPHPAPRTTADTTAGPDALPKAQEPAAPATTTAPPTQRTAEPGPLRLGSGALARVLTMVWAALAVPLGIALLAWGGSTFSQFVLRSGLRGDVMEELVTAGLLVPVALGTGGGSLLLLSVVLSGIASSAGLLLTGVPALAAVALSIAPALVATATQGLPARPTILLLEAMSVGMAQFPLLVLFGCGIALAASRRRPRAPLFLVLLGLVLLPVLLAGGLVASIQGNLQVTRRFVVTMRDPQLDSVGTLLLVLGAALIVGALAASRWSPAALILPALVAAALTVHLLLFLAGILPLDAPGSGIWRNVRGMEAAGFFVAGGGVVLGLLLLAHSLVMAAVRLRARRREAAAIA